MTTEKPATLLRRDARLFEAAELLDFAAARLRELHPDCWGDAVLVGRDAGRWVVSVYLPRRNARLRVMKPYWTQVYGHGDTLDEAIEDLRISAHWQRTGTLPEES